MLAHGGLQEVGTNAGNFQVGKDAQKFVEKNKFEDKDDEGCSGTQTFFLSWECISRI